VTDCDAVSAVDCPGPEGMSSDRSGDADESDGVRGMRRSTGAGTVRCTRSATAWSGEAQVRIEASGMQYGDVLGNLPATCALVICRAASS
jgi:hypothetical protein